MDYTLAKKLKDAGFPVDCGQTFCDGCEYFPADGDFKGEWCHVPTLSELIEACGDDIESIVLQKADGYLMKRCWRAYPTESAYVEKMKGDCVVDCCGYITGSTPEEAVANLWLELNKK